MREAVAPAPAASKDTNNVAVFAPRLAAQRLSARMVSGVMHHTRLFLPSSGQRQRSTRATYATTKTNNIVPNPKKVPLPNPQRRWRKYPAPPPKTTNKMMSSNDIADLPLSLPSADQWRARDRNSCAAWNQSSSDDPSGQPLACHK